MIKTRSLSNSSFTQKDSYYGPNGNLVRKEMPNGLTVDYNYNDLNLLTEEIKVRAGDVMSRKMAYDGTGSLVASSDARGTLTALSYYEDGQIKEQVYYLPEVENNQIADLSQITPENVPTGYVEDERIAYSYDEVGRLTDINDKLGSLHYDYTKLNQIAREIRVTEGNIYTTEYGYDFVGNLTRMKYPESNEWVTYEYNELDQLKNISREVEGVKTDILNNLNYDPAGNLIAINYHNNVETSLIPDIMSRVESIAVKRTGSPNPLLDLNYGYDVNGNVVRRNENIYTYDVLDRLKAAEVDGTFLVDTPAKMGYVDHDYFVNDNLDYELANIEIDFDYAASTLGLRLDKTQKVGRVEIIPNEIVDHRVEKSGIRLFYRQNVGEDFTEITPEDWVFKKDLSGKIVITFKNAITAWEIKIHSNHDERDIVTGDVVNNAELSGSLQEMVRVYGRYERTQISYEYDVVGNRIEERYTDVTNDYSIAYSYNYYAGSNRLKERVSNGAPDFTGLNGSYLDGIFRIGQNEKMAYEYDKAGNMVAKGNRYTFSGENVVFNGSEGSIHWEYNYNGRNRLNEVIKSGEKVASYGYDYSGKRLKVDEGGKLIYFVYNYLGQMIYEDQRTEQKQISYYYGLGRIIAKSEKGNGVQDGEEIYYYHHDNLGSTMLITDGAGEVVFEQDYAPFGQDLYKAGTYEKPDQSVEAGYKYTGQKEDTLTGLYYYGARYYDPEIGRFVTEDTYQGDIFNSLTQNLYLYVLQNPLKYVDPTGHIPVMDVDGPTEDIGNGPTATITDDEIDQLEDMIRNDERLSREQKNDLKDVTNTLRDNNTDLEQYYDKIDTEMDLIERLRNEGKISDDAYNIAIENIIYREDSGSVRVVPFYDDPAFVIPASIAFVVTGGVNATVAIVSQAFNTLYFKAQNLWWRLLNKVDKATKGAGSSNLVNYGHDFGKMGTYVENPGISVNWDITTIHGSERMLERGITPDMVNNWVTYGKALAQDGGNKFAYVTREGVAVVSNVGKLITAWAKEDFNANMELIIKALFGE